MGKIAEPPKSVDDIDSPRHRGMCEVFVGIKPGTPECAYGDLAGYLKQYGKVGWTEKEDAALGRKPFMIVLCSDQKAGELVSSHKQNGKGTALEYSNTVYRMGKVRLI